MKKIINITLVIIIVFTLSSCGLDVDTNGDLRFIGEYDSKIYYNVYSDALDIDNAIYEITGNGYDLVYDLTDIQYGISVINGKFLITEYIYEYDYSLYPNTNEFFFVDIETGNVTELPIIDTILYFIIFNEDNNTILFRGESDSTFYIYDILSNTFIQQYTLEGVHLNLIYSYYLNNRLYIESPHLDSYNYIYDFETEELIDVTSNIDLLTSSYSSVHTVYHYIDDTNIFQFISLRMGWQMSADNDDRTYDIIKVDSDYNLVDTFEVPRSYFYDFSEDNFLVYNRISIDGMVNVSIYDLDFNFDTTLNIPASCDSVNIITNELLECSSWKTQGALLQTYHSRKVIYSLLTGDKLIDSGWVQTSSQAKAINIEKND